MGWLSDLLQGVQSVPLNSVLRERVLLAEQKFKDLESENKELTERVAALTAENASLRQQVEEHAQQKAAKPKVKWGCYVFEGDEKLYCPACWDTKGKKHLTTRMLANIRQCSVCKAQLGT